MMLTALLFLRFHTSITMIGKEKLLNRYIRREWKSYKRNFILRKIKLNNKVVKTYLQYVRSLIKFKIKEL